MLTSLLPVFLATLLKEAESSSNAVFLLLEDGDSPWYHFFAKSSYAAEPVDPNKSCR